MKKDDGGMEKLTTEFAGKSIKDFVSELSSKAPVPGGGGAAALAGALGAALGGMVANLTIGKPRYADVEQEIEKLKSDVIRIQTELIALIERDAAAFAPLADAYRMPKDTETERAARAEVMEMSFKNAALVPLEIMKKCGEAIVLMETFAKKGSKLAVSDAACGAILCKSALQSAWLNVVVNTAGMRDESFAAHVNDEGEKLLNAYLPLADAIYAAVERQYMLRGTVANAEGAAE